MISLLTHTSLKICSLAFSCSLLCHPTTENVGPVKPDETAATLWGDDKPEPKEAFEANGFQMRRVVLTRPPGRFGGRNGRNRRNNKKDDKPAE